MAEELNVNDGQKVETPNGANGQVVLPSRSEQRHEDLVSKLKEQEGRHTLEIEARDKAKLEVEAKLRATEFELGLTKESSKYPNAIKHKDEIKSYVDKGLSVEDATKLVLVNKNELVTGQDITRERVDSSSFGGSSATTTISDEKNPGKMTQAERRAALEDLESKGKFGVRDNAIFLE